MLFLKNFDIKGEKFFIFQEAYFEGEYLQKKIRTLKIVSIQIILIYVSFYPYKSNVCYHQKRGDYWLSESQSKLVLF